MKYEEGHTKEFIRLWQKYLENLHELSEEERKAFVDMVKILSTPKMWVAGWRDEDVVK